MKPPSRRMKERGQLAVCVGLWAVTIATFAVCAVRDASVWWLCLVGPLFLAAFGSVFWVIAEPDR